ncbi:MAG: serine acetyltransferase [Clostridia bacterium]|nr:serine acetyltransferase [Clostridia bacterium]
MDFINKTLSKLHGLDEQSKLKATHKNDPIPSRDVVAGIIKDVQAVLFPNYFKASVDVNTEAVLFSIYSKLKGEIEMACSFSEANIGMTADEAATKFVETLPEIKSMLLKDIEALYEGDPAAKYRDEVIICYPGFFATVVYRVAHVLYQMRVPLIPRMMTEFAHQKTGIDIHAGATIGEYFFIDHGTGIVIGETTVIGNHVKLYQGVTLGAKSFELDENGNPIKDLKRHPNIEDDVIIYANATVLGGRTTVGKGSVIGGNTWLVKSVEPGSTVYYSNENPTS